MRRPQAPQALQGRWCRCAWALLPCAPHRRAGPCLAVLAPPRNAPATPTKPPPPAWCLRCTCTCTAPRRRAAVRWAGLVSGGRHCVAQDCARGQRVGQAALVLRRPAGAVARPRPAWPGEWTGLGCWGRGGQGGCGSVTRGRAGQDWAGRQGREQGASGALHSGQATTAEGTRLVSGWKLSRRAKSGEVHPERQAGSTERVGRGLTPRHSQDTVREGTELRTQRRDDLQ